MEQYLKDDQQEKLKDMLYGYLKDKAQRREGVTSKATYEGAEDQFVNQMRLRDVGSLAGAFSEAASGVGQIQGKRAQSDIIPNVNKDLYGSTQGAYENFRTLRDAEERSNMNDLNVARYVSQMEQSNDDDKLARRKMDLSEKEYADLEPRRKLEMQLKQKQLDAQPSMRRRLQPNLVSPDGNPVTLGEDGLPQDLPGYKFRETKPAAANTERILAWDETGGKMLVQTPQGQVVRNAPTGFRKAGKAGESEDGKRMTEGTTLKLNQAKDAFAEAESVQKSLDLWKSKMGPIEGNLRSINPWDTDAQKFQADLKRAAQVIGRYMEDGVLVPADVPKYEAMLPKFGDKPEVAQYKLDQMKVMLKEKQRRDTDALRSQGYKTPENGNGKEVRKVRVRNKQTGKTGTVSEQYLDPQKYEVIE